MDKKTFQQGMVLLSEAFPNLEFSEPLYWMMLQETEDKAFLKAVVDVVKNTIELYPTSNLIAILNEKAKYFHSENTRKDRESRQKIEYKNFQDTRTEEWHQMIRDIAEKKNITKIKS